MNIIRYHKKVNYPDSIHCFILDEIYLIWYLTKVDAYISLVIKKTKFYEV